MPAIESIGGSAFLAELISNVPTSSHITKYAEIVLEKSRRRQLAEVGRKLTTFAQEDDQSADDLTEFAEQEIVELSQHAGKHDPSALGDLRMERYDHYANVYEADDPTPFCGLPTRFTDVDKKLGGLAPGQLIILAGRPAMGKTAFALDVATNVACEQNQSVLICSLEMTKEELFGRILSKRLGVESWRLERGSIDSADFGRMGPVLDDFANYPLYIDDDPDTSITNIRSKARCQKMRHGLDLLIVDYLQLMDVPGKIAGENQTQRITYLSRSLKQLARDLRIPVIALSQLSRACEQRTDKRPVLSDLRDSGSIEQDADKILMLYRESEYEEDCENPDHTSVLIRKNRHGPTGEVVLRFDRGTMSFVSLNTPPTPVEQVST